MGFTEGRSEPKFITPPQGDDYDEETNLRGTEIIDVDELVDLGEMGIDARTSAGLNKTPATGHATEGEQQYSRGTVNPENEPKIQQLKKRAVGKPLPPIIKDWLDKHFKSPPTKGPSQHR